MLVEYTLSRKELKKNVTHDRERKWFLYQNQREKKRKKRGSVSFIESWIIEACTFQLQSSHITIKGLGMVGQTSILSFKRIYNLMETAETMISSTNGPQIPSERN